MWVEFCEVDMKRYVASPFLVSRHPGVYSLWLLSSVLLAVLSADAQPSWHPPVQITSGAGNDIHVTAVDVPGPSFRVPDMIAFSREGRNVCVMRTDSTGATWNNEVEFVTTDSADNDFPSFAALPGIPMLVWQSRRDADENIYYARGTGAGWTSPLPVTRLPGEDTHPHIALTANGFALAWEHEGSILLAEYRDSAWTAPTWITSPPDSGNMSPQVAFSYWPVNTLVVVWQKELSPGGRNVLLYSYQSGSSWTAPETLTVGRDGRNPSFYKVTSSALAWDDSDPTVYSPRIVASGFSMYGGVPGWSQPEPVDLSGVRSSHGSFNGYSIVTEHSGSGFPFYRIATWEQGDSPADTIVCRNIFEGPGYMTVPSGSVVRNPHITVGAGDLSHYNVWSVWESNTAGQWNLFGSRITLRLDDVAESPALPDHPALWQNYPNPFNPVTEIRYALPVGSRIRLSIFTLLGQEIATLVDAEQNAGYHAVTWNGTTASGAPAASGVYLYRIEGRGFSDARRMLLMR